MSKLLLKIRRSSWMRLAHKHWLTLMFIFGFVGDFLLLNKVDDAFDNSILFFYVVLAAVSIILLYAAVAGKLPEKINDFFRRYTPMALQYAFGGLLSGMLIFYGRSSSLADGWPFLLIFAVVIYLNETTKDRAGRLVLTISMFFVGLLSYVVLVVPVFTGKMGEWVFVGSGALALLLMLGLLYILRQIVPNFISLHWRVLLFSVGSIFVTMNFLYFTNIIPPIPLSLKDVGIFHSVVRFEDDTYQLKYEEGEWWEFWKDSDTTFHPSNGGNVFCFAKVFAPTRLDTNIYHRWERYDEGTNKWVDHSRISYFISGGRSSGYRGYTQIGNFSDGKWRCSVETARGQILGRVKFTIDSDADPKELGVRFD